MQNTVTKSKMSRKILTLHGTNKAFERYFSMEADDLRSIYQDTGKVINLDKSRIENI
jgi:hypothetical protein